MDVNELRIGNLILKDGEEIIVSSYTFYNVEKDNESYNPIELTEEWLLKFGFIKNGFGEKTKSINPFDRGIKELVFESDYLFLRDCDENVLSMDNHSLTTLWNKDLRKNFYVHQLQNLYFALTGEELKLN